MWDLDYKESWVPNNWCFQIVVLEKTLESPLDGMKIKPVNPKWHQPWIITGRTDAKAEAPMLWPPNGKSQITGKDFGAGKDWKQKEKRVTEDEMVREHHWINGQEFEQTLGDSEGQESLVCCMHGITEWTQLGNWTTTTNWLTSVVLGPSFSNRMWAPLEQGSLFFLFIDVSQHLV